MSETNIPDTVLYPTDIPLPICPDLYNPCDDTGVVTSYFNPLNYETKFSNFRIFEESIRKSNIYMLIVECVFGEAEFTLNDFPNVLKIRAKDILWQKERLLNIAISRLPRHIKKVVWLDCDVLFTNHNWLVDTSELLEEYPVVQPFEISIRLPKGERCYGGKGEVWNSFGYINAYRPHLVASGDFQLHGHTGFAWAAKLDLLKTHGLYDACISGSGDHIMAHAMCGDFEHPCLQRMMSAKLWPHFLDWGRGFYQDVGSRVGCTTGTLLHLWHGDTKNRQYLQRHDELIQHGFDPVEDIHMEESGTWCWKSYKPDLHRWAVQYFQGRLEDDDS